MKKDIILVRPNRHDYNRRSGVIFFHQPLNLCYLAACLEERGFKTAIYDLELEGSSVRGLLALIRESSAKAVGFTCYTNTVSLANKLALYIKSLSPHIVTIAGGRHISALPERTLEEFQGFDIGVTGEGEEILPELLMRIMSKSDLTGLPGIVFRGKNSIVKNTHSVTIKDLDKLPFPARHLLDWDAYDRQPPAREFLSKGRRLASIVTARGCPYNCTFCAVNTGYGEHKARFRSSDSVLAETEECLNRYRISHLDILDDTFTLDIPRLYRILSGFERLGINSWACQTRVDAIDKKKLSDMACAGCKEIFLGAESGSQHVLDSLKKGITTAQIEDAFRWSKEAGIEFVKLSCLIGSPEETPADMAMTYRMLKKLNADRVYINILVPYPGTEIYDIMKKKGLIMSEDWSRFCMYGAHPQWHTDYFSPGKLIAAQRRMLLGYYIRPSYLWKRLCTAFAKKRITWWYNAAVMGLYIFLNNRRKKG
jgi:anaerobic magnesium-protoporphyrin IX monomethyl ester cyclase